MADPNDPAERRRTAWMIYDYLSQAPLCLPLAEPAPKGGPLQEVQPVPDALARVMVSVDPRTGHTALAAFIDDQTLAARFPGALFVRLPADAVLAMVAGGKYDALFVNPEGQWTTFDRAAVAELLEAGRGGRPS